MTRRKWATRCPLLVVTHVFGRILSKASNMELGHASRLKERRRTSKETRTTLSIRWGSVMFVLNELQFGRQYAARRPPDLKFRNLKLKILGSSSINGTLRPILQPTGTSPSSKPESSRATHTCRLREFSTTSWHHDEVPSSLGTCDWDLKSSNAHLLGMCQTEKMDGNSCVL
jgi:hypothetical protein